MTTSETDSESSPPPGDAAPEPPRRARTKFPGLSSRAYEHPADRAALVALRAVPGFDLVLRKMMGLIGDRSLRLVYLGSAVRVNERQFVRIHALYQECLEILDVKIRPDLYVAQTPFVNAGAVGIDQPFIVLNSGLLQTLGDLEIQTVLAHELGHILSGHVLYKTMLRILLRLSILAAGVPVAAWTLTAIMAALREWDRKSELSADRAGLLVSQDLEISFGLLMKLAGGGNVQEMNLEEFIRQAEEYESGGDLLDSVLKLLNIVDMSHPFPVLRLAELKRWSESDEYRRIMSGDYSRTDEDLHASLVSEIKASFRSYKDRYDDSRDPLTSFFRDLGESVSSSSRDFLQRFKKDRDKPDAGKPDADKPDADK